MSETAPQPRSKWFWGNLLALLLLVPLATVLFERHFKLYFNQVILVGGALTLWTLVHLLWGLFASATKFDAEDFSRKWLNSPAATRALIVAAIVLAYMWWSTASLYFDFAGEAARVYKLEVLRTGTGQHYLEPFQISSSDRTLLKDLQLVRSEKVQLRCLIVDPVGFEPFDCSIFPGRSTRVQVPAGFKLKEYHLIRLIPLGPLYRKLPPVGQVERSNFDLEVSVLHQDGTKSAVERFEDLRKRTINVVPQDERERMPVLRLGTPENHRESILARYLQDYGSDEGRTADEFARVLESNTKNWPLTSLRQGDQLSVDVVRVPVESVPSSGQRFNITQKITAEPVQIIWLSPPN
jgi:hypothetical protein